MRNKEKKLKTFLTIMCTLLSISINAQNVVTGIVKDDLNEPLAGTTVAVKGTTIGAVTNIDGQFSIKIPDGEKTLEFSFIGYKTKKVTYKGQKTINVSLEPDQFMLDEVVAIGYGVQRKRDITGSIATVSAEEIEKQQPVSVFDALQGSSPGIMVIGNSAAPGEEGSSTVRIRGTSTLEGGAEPLYVVDGVPTDDISMINPSDIQSMEVLKDAASAAIYGSRSANGVILITTKEGELGKPKINVQYLHSWSTLSRKLPQANADDRRAFDYRGNISLVTDAQDPFAYNRTGNYDYQDMLAQTASRDQIDLSLRGSTDKFNYMASLGYLNQTGIIINSWSKRLTGRVNVTYNATKRITLVSNLSYSYQNSNAIPESTTIQMGLKRPAYYVLYYPDGSYMFDNAGQKNPIAETIYDTKNSQQYSTTIYQAVQLKIFPWLQFEANVNGTFKLGRGDNLRSKVLVANQAYATASDNTSFYRSLIGESFFSFNKKFGKHSLSGVLGMSAQENRSEGMKFAGQGMISEEIHFTNSYQQWLIDKSGTSATESALVGIFARASYNYKGRYLANMTVRRDGSSRFTNNRWGTFPSASIGWRFSDESFMRWSRNFLKDGKLRVSYGVTGNQRIGDYESIIAYSLSNIYYQADPGVSLSSLFGNPDLKWETTTQLNAGLDLALFKGRLAVSLDYYDKQTKDLLYSARMNSELGYSNKKINLGAIQNRGVEVDINIYPVQTKNFSWNTRIGFSLNRNKIVSLATRDYIQGDAWLVAAGQAVGQFYGFSNLGVYAYNESNAYTSDMKIRLAPVFRRDDFNNVILDNEGNPELLQYLYPDGSEYTGQVKQMKVGNTVLRGGDMIWDDLDNNGIIDDADRKILGSGSPDWQGSWNNTLTYKDFTFSFSFYGSFGAKIFNREDFSKNTYANNGLTPRPYVVYNAWRFPGQQTDMPQAARSTVNNTSRVLTASYLEDGSFIRLNNVKLSYRLNSRYARKVGLDGISAYVYGRNVMTWTSYTGYDPEFSSGTLTPGDDRGRYPRKRELGIGINVNL